MLILICNFCFYFTYFIFLFIKEGKRISLVSFIFLMESIIALLGCLTFNYGIYQKTFGEKKASDLTIIPYIFNFIAVLIASWPLRKFKINDLKISKRLYNVLNTISIVTSLLSVAYSFSLLLFYKITSSLSYAEVYSDARFDQIQNFDNPIINFMFVDCYRIVKILTPFVLTFQFYNILNKYSVKKTFFIIAIIIVPQLVGCILLSARGRLFFLFLDMAYFLILFVHKFALKYKKIIYYVGAFIVIIALSFVMAITISRTEFSSHNNAIDGIARYFGEPFPNLCFLYWNETQIKHPMGKRQYYGIYRRLNNEITIEHGVGYRQDYWSYFTKVPIYNFKTLYGDLYVEFGVFLPFCILLFISIIYYKVRISLSPYFKIIMLCCCYRMCVFGLFDFVADVGLFDFLISLCICFILKLYNTTNRDFILSQK